MAREKYQSGSYAYLVQSYYFVTSCFNHLLVVAKVVVRL